MKKANQPSSDSLREQAENKLKSLSPKPEMSASEADAYNLIHEPEVHQIRSEIQTKDSENITNHKKKQDKLHLSISRSTQILDEMLEGCMIIGFDWTYIYINESAARNGQSKRENLIGRSMLEMYPGVENSSVFAHYKRCMDERIPQRFEESFTFVDGTTVWNNFSVEPVKEGIFILALDITSRKNIEEELWRNEARLKVSLGLINFTVFNQDLDLRYTWLFQSQIGLTFEQVNGKTDEELLPPETAQKVTEIKRSVLESGRSKRGKVELNRNGKILYYDLFVEPLFSIDGQIIGITGASLDITEQKKAEDTLRISEAKWRELFEILPIGVSIVDSNRKILDFNSALCQILDLSPDDLLNNKHLGIKYWKSDHTLINPKELPSYRAIQENKTLKDLEICVEKENGSRIWINVNAAPFPTLKSSIVATIDITERKKWEEEIKSSKMQMDQLYKHINAVREEERSAIAREIHDELGQSLASLKIDLIVMKEEFDENSELKHKIDQVLTQVDSSIKTVQKISSSLRPQMLDELGLSSAIEWLSNDFRKRTGIKCKLDLQEIEDLDDNLSISLFRIFQASLANIMLHSKAGSISVKLSLNNGLLLLSVKDDGIGITEEQINSPHSFGIIGMSERAKQIDGKFEIHSEINKGTEITVLVPVICKK